jgi:endonuclease YncB( thermonuclease family)
MGVKWWNKYVVMLLLITFLLLGYLSDFPASQKSVMTPVEIQRVIDGDTFSYNDSKFRLMGINTPERGEYYYGEARAFLEGFVGKSGVFLFVSLDKYDRNLGYLFVDGLMVNNELLKRGMASTYYYDTDSYTSGLLVSELFAQNNNLGIWQLSNDYCSKCVFISSINNGAKMDDCKAGVESVTFSNDCAHSCSVYGWSVKDSATHKYVFSNLTISSYSNITLLSGKGEDFDNFFFWNNFDFCSSVWNDDGDTVYLRDSAGLLVDFYRY